jgi:putative transposase
VNAARNIVTAGRAGTLNACGDGVRPGPVQAAVGETGTRRSAV